MLRSRSLNMMHGARPMLCDMGHTGLRACFAAVLGEGVERTVRPGV